MSVNLFFIILSLLALIFTYLGFKVQGLIYPLFAIVVLIIFMINLYVIGEQAEELKLGMFYTLIIGFIGLNLFQLIKIVQQ